jgi:DNA-binding NtrC family response regulator
MGGTLVLDGVELLTPPAQARLARLLGVPAAVARHDSKWDPLGIRLVTLTRESLEERLAAGNLLECLYYRLGGVRIHVPRLHKRAADLCQLVTQLIDELEPPGATRPEVLPAAWEALSRYAFPGNVRELRWILEHALALSEGGPIEIGHLPEEVRTQAVTDVTER